jgi:hypothetical protein
MKIESPLYLFHAYPYSSQISDILAMIAPTDQLTDASIYLRALESPMRGTPIFCPETSIHIGDVGFFSQDELGHPKFIRMLNVLRDPGDAGRTIYGVSENFITYQKYYNRCNKTPLLRLYEITPDYYQAGQLRGRYEPLDVPTHIYQFVLTSVSVFNF